MKVTKKKKCLGFIYSEPTPKILNNILSNNFHHINNIATSFEEIHILNLNNFRLFNKIFFGFEKVFNKFNFNKNVKFYNPKNISELDSFFKDKSLHAVLSLGKTFSELPIFLLLKKYDVKLFKISNIGNKQYGDIPLKTNFLKSYLNIWGRNFMHKLYIMLNVIGLISKIEIRFMSNKHWINLSKKNKSIYNKLFRFFNFSYAKKLIVINSRAYDLFSKNKFIKNEKYIVLLDEMLNDPQYVRLRGFIDKKKIDTHYKNLVEKLIIISKYYKKKVVICLHPSDDLNFKKKIFSHFLVKQHETKKYIYQSKLVLFFESSAIIDAIMLKKKIMTIFSNVLDINQIAHNMNYVNEMMIPSLNVDDDLLFEKNTINKFKYNKKKINFTYNKYIKKYIAADTSNILGYKKFANIIKKEYFRS